MTLYTVNPDKDGYRISKLTEDLDPLEVYLVNAYRNGRVKSCTCPAGSHRKYCRHHEIFKAFFDAHKIGLGWFYSYDLKKWIEPLKIL